MQVGDLVKWSPDLPMHFSRDFGIVIEIIDGYLAGILWYGSTEVYLEPIRDLEVISESR